MPSASADGPGLRIEPLEVHFKDDQPAQRTISLRNVGTSLRSVQVRPPKTRAFALSNVPRGVRLAPGMSTTLTVAYRAPDTVPQSDVRDEVTILSEGAAVPVALLRPAARPNIGLHGDTDFACVPAGATVARDIVVRNSGNADGAWTLRVDGELSVGLSAASGTLRPGEEAAVSVVLRDVDAGQAAADLVLTTAGDAHPQRVAVRVTAVAVSHDLLATDGSLVTEVDFGNVFEGARCTRTLHLHNNSPTPLKFSVDLGSAASVAARSAHGDGGDGGDGDGNPHAAFVAAARARAQAVTAEASDPFEVSPRTGEVPPFTKLPLAVEYCPRGGPPAIGFSAAQDTAPRVHRFAAVLECAGASGAGKQARVLPLSGTALPRAIEVAPRRLVFGDVPCHGHRHLHVELRNLAPDRVVRFAARRTVPHFFVEPAEGAVAPGAMQFLAVMFRPRALGRFSGALALEIRTECGELIAEETVAVAASASVVGDAEARPGGSAALPEDFAYERRHATEEEIARGARARPPKFTRPEPVATDELAMKTGKLELTEDQYMHGSAERTLIAAHRGFYDGFLRQQRRARKAGGKVASGGDDINLGMDPWAGMGAGEPKISTQAEPLWLADSNLPAKCTLFKGFAADVAAAMTTHPAHAQSKEEAKVTRAALTATELRGVLAGPATLAFGRVSAAAEAVQHFCVHNTLARPVHVLVDALCHDHLALSANTSQFVPAHGCAAFPITLLSAEPRAFSHRLEYVVNGAHLGEVELAADVRAVELQLSATELDFAFSLDDWLPHVDRVLLLDNPNPFAAAYAWENAAPGVFNVAPVAGMVPAMSTAETAIRWAPPLQDGVAAGAQGGELTLQIQGGATRRVQLRTALPEGAVAFRQRRLDAGAVPIGLPAVADAELVNKGRADTSFRVVSSPGLECTPRHAVIPAGDSRILQLRFTAADVTPISTSVAVELRGGKVIKLAVEATPTHPHVTVEEDEFDFARVYLGGSKRLPLTLVNASPVEACVAVDLRAYPAFQLSIDKADWPVAEYLHCPLSADRALQNFASQASAGLRATSSGPDGEPVEGARYTVRVNPNSSLRLRLAFHARRIADHAFALPLALPLALLPEGVAPVPPPERLVAAECLATRITVSHAAFEWGPCIVSGRSCVRPPYEQVLQLTNVQDAVMHWHVRRPLGEDPEASGDVFSLEEQSGELAPHDSTCVKILFQPRAAVAYRATAELCARLPDEEAALPILSLELAGSGRRPCLTFDRPCVLLPAVPLGVRSTATFHVRNDGYDNLDLTVRLPADMQNIPLEASFPEGTMVGIAKAAVPVVLTFRAARPTSFTASVEFLDEDGARYAVEVIGCTDNSVLTLEPFIAANEPALAADGAEAVRVDTESDFCMPEPAAALAMPAVPPLLTTYLNSTTLRHYDDLIKESVQSNGKVLSSIVELLAGKAIPGKAKSFSSDKSRAAEQLVAHYEAVLLFLQRHGALVSSVSPEALLAPEAADLLADMREARASSAAELEALQQRQEERQAQDCDVMARHAWTFLYLQIARTFILQRIDVPSLRSLPGTVAADVPSAAALTGSNIYSAAESVLLAWLEVHWRAQLPDAAGRLTAFDEPLRDGVVLCCLVVSHWPPLERFLEQLVEAPASPADCEANAKLLLRMLDLLQCPFAIREEQITAAARLDMVFFVAFLYSWLPALQPRATVTFAGKLQEEQVREIQLENPSGRELSYSARLHGHEDFTLDTHTVRVAAKGAAVARVRCKPTTGVAQTARLVLATRRDGEAMAATLAFELVSAVNTKAPLKRITVERALYEMKHFDFKLLNPFPADCDFEITLVHGPAQPEAPAADKSALARGAAGKPRKPRKRKEAELPAWAQGQLFPDAFGIARSRVCIKRNAEERIKGAFLPFTLAPKHCTVVFTDREQGSFCLELVGHVLPPSILAEHQLTVDLNSPATQWLDLAPRNGRLEAAKKAFAEGHPLARVKEQLALLRGRGKGQAAAGPAPGEPMRYEVKHSSSLITCPGEVFLTDAADAAAAPDGSRANALRLDLKPIGTGLYPDRIMLTSPYDVRIVDVEISARELGRSFALDFCTQARQSTTQAVPLINASDSPMTVVATITAELESEGVFSGPPEVTVPAGSEGSYALTFAPPWTGSYAATLVLAIPATLETNTYTLAGRGAEPAASDHVRLRCAARGSRAASVVVTNAATAAQEFHVFSDLAGICGPDTLLVGAASQATYAFTYAPPLSGSFTGTLTFSSAAGQYVWFTVEASVAPAPKQDTISVSAPVRSAVELAVPITNPLNAPLSLAVDYGHANLTGPRALALAPSERAEFVFYFAPLTACAGTDAVTLSHPDVGEFWYEVRHAAEAGGATTVPRVSCPVGSSVQRGVPFVNPLDRAAAFAVSVAGAGSFAAAAGPLRLGPGAAAEVAVTYTPRGIGSVEDATLTLTSQEAGSFDFALTGCGAPPDALPAAHVSSRLHAEAIAPLEIRNPFDEEASFLLALASAEPTAAELRLHDASDAPVTVAPHGVLRFHVVYTPRCGEGASATVTARCSCACSDAPIVFEMPVLASVDADTRGAQVSLRGKAKQLLQHTVHLTAPAGEDLGACGGLTAHVHLPETTPPTEQASAAVVGYDAETGAIAVLLTWRPLQPGCTAGELIIQKAAGGRCKYALLLEAEAADVDGTIVCEAHVRRTASVAVHVFASGAEPEAFEAAISEDSAFNFACKPERGTLPPCPSPGQPQPPAAVEVHFTCTDFGRVVHGTLHVHSACAQYTFALVGREPVYHPPEVASIRPKVDDRLSPDVARMLAASRAPKKTNFQQANIAKARRGGL